MKVPVSIIKTIHSKIFHFICAGKSQLNKFHLAKWESLSWPKKMGGWGLLNLDYFNLALRPKSMWRALSDNGLWRSVIIHKYLKNFSTLQWIRNPVTYCKNASLIWCGLIGTFPYIGDFLSWCIGMGSQIYILIDPYVGARDNYKLSSMALDELHKRHILVLSQVFHSGEELSKPHWLNVEELGFPDNLHLNGILILETLHSMGYYYLIHMTI